jgi:hypothetical protein
MTPAKDELSPLDRALVLCSRDFRRRGLELRQKETCPEESSADSGQAAERQDAKESRHEQFHPIR